MNLSETMFQGLEEGAAGARGGADMWFYAAVARKSGC